MLVVSVRVVGPVVPVVPVTTPYMVCSCPRHLQPSASFPGIPTLRPGRQLIWEGNPVPSEAMRVAVKIRTKRDLCGTTEAAEIYGCRVSHIRGMATRGEIWSEQVSTRSFVYDANQIRQLAAERDSLRKAGKLCGRRPGGRK